MPDKKPTHEIPDDVIESFARCLLPSIQRYFDSEEGQNEFEKWISEKRNTN